MKNLCTLFIFLTFTFLTAQEQECSHTFGGDSHDYPNTILTDLEGNIYIEGGFQGLVDFDPGPNTFELDSGNFGGAYISKFDANGNFLWTKVFSSPLL